MIEFVRSRHVDAMPERIWPSRVPAPRPIGRAFETSLERLAALAEGSAGPS